MATKIATRSEILKRVAELEIETSIPAAQMKSAELMKLIVAKEDEIAAANPAPAGRPVDPNSTRQKRLAEIEAMRKEREALGLPLRGRLPDPNSDRQKRLAEMEAKRKLAEEGIIEIKKGRPSNPESARQKRLAEMEAKRQAGELRRGRPKQDLAIEIIDDVPVETIETITEEVVVSKKSKSKKVIAE